MYTSANSDVILVENDLFATVKVRLDECKARMSSIIGLGSKIYKNKLDFINKFIKVHLHQLVLVILWKEVIMEE